MAHEITSTDGAVYVGEPAWHGLGRVVENAPTPGEALLLAKLNWKVEQHPLVAVDTDNNVRIAVDTHVANIRSDTRSVLGVVGEGYVPIQNEELADFASSLSEDSGGIVKVESAASICGGKRVWFLLRANSFNVKGFNDEVRPYILLANGHDGSLALHVRPTSVRVVCNNTLTLALGEKSDLKVRIRHEGNLKEKLSEVKRVLGLFDKQRAGFEEKVNLLSARKLNREELQRFFLEVYENAYEPIAENPTTEKGKKARKAALETIGAFGKVFDRERGIVGESAWAALNAVTGYIQKIDHVRGKDDRSRNENRLKSKLFGTIEERTNTAAKLALALV